MTDADLVAERLAFIETCLRELRELARPDLIGADVRETRFVEHTLQVAIQAGLDVASHIVSDRRLGEPTSNRQLFDLLVSDGWLPPGLLPQLRDMAGFRNILVHGYQRVDPEVVRDVVAHRLHDLADFVAAVRRRDPDLSNPQPASPDQDPDSTDG
jgi:uncharacterized protein YutE (UPF0331/DUF86 family)